MSKMVMLDAGHGGKDPGAIGDGLHEADCVLKLVQYEAVLWRQLGVDVVLTRDSDTYLSLNQRITPENKLRPACYISHHMDAGPESASGATVWLHSKAPATYAAWAADILTELSKVGITSNRAQLVNRGYRGNPNQNYAVNRDTVGPSMLLELGFITNAANRAEFAAHYKDYARAIVVATCRFIGVDSSGLDVQDDSPDSIPSASEKIAKLQADIVDLKAQLAKTDALRRTAVQNISDMSAAIVAIAHKYTA